VHGSEVAGVAGIAAPVAMGGGFQDTDRGAEFGSSDCCRHSGLSATNDEDIVTLTRHFRKPQLHANLIFFYSRRRR
jgi:hypothetical protein